MWWKVVGLVVGVVVAAAGCTGGSDAGSSWHPSTPQPTYRDGEIRQQRLAGICASVSRSTLRGFGIAESVPDTDDGGSDEPFTDCRWSRQAHNRLRESNRTLTVRFHAYDPPATRRTYSATKEAQAKFRRPDGWERRHATPVSGLGDEAKVSRTLDLTGPGGGVWLAVRQRNVVLDVHAEVSGADVTTGLTRKPTLTALETTARSTMDDLLTKLPAPASWPRQPAVEGGEVARVKNVCDAVRTAHHPAARPVDTTTPGATTAAGCRWSEGPVRPELSVGVQAIAPSRIDGRSGTSVAGDLLDGVVGTRSGAPNLGVDAKVYRFSYHAGESRTVRVHVRKGNLLVTVQYERWRHPSQRRLERDATAVAEDVLAGYR